MSQLKQKESVLMKIFNLIFHFKGQNTSYIDICQLTVNFYVACVYDSHQFFGLIVLNDEEEGNAYQQTCKWKTSEHFHKNVEKIRTLKNMQNTEK